MQLLQKIFTHVFHLDWFDCLETYEYKIKETRYATASLQQCVSYIISLNVKASLDIQKASWEKRDEKTDSGDRVKKFQYCGSKAVHNRNHVE